jgi:Major Facilitator Superfamily
LRAARVVQDQAPRAMQEVGLGLAANWPQFSRLVLVNVFVGGMVGLARATTSLVGTRVWLDCGRQRAARRQPGIGLVDDREREDRLGGAAGPGHGHGPAGTAMVYPALIASVADHTGPAWRAQGFAVYRLWRDLGYALGVVLTGLVAQAAGISAAVIAGGALTFISGLLAARWITGRRGRTANAGTCRPCGSSSPSAPPARQLITRTNQPCGRVTSITTHHRRYDLFGYLTWPCDSAVRPVGTFFGPFPPGPGHFTAANEGPAAARLKFSTTRLAHMSFG